MSDVRVDGDLSWGLVQTSIIWSYIESPSDRGFSNRVPIWYE